MKKINSVFSLALLVFCMGCIYSCNNKVNPDFRKNYADANKFMHEEAPDVSFFKAHMKNGDVSILEEWKLNPAKDSLLGKGHLYNFNRGKIHEGKISVPINEIAIIETNQLSQIQAKDAGRVAALAILTAANIAIHAVCITNPKACFGSCPTFYIDGNRMIHTASAEGFSSSISPSLEKVDLDALQSQTSSDEFYLTMKNEAFETHMVNQVMLYAVPKQRSQVVLHDRKGMFYKCRGRYELNTLGNQQPESAVALKNLDDLEYFSLTDSTDLTKKEEIILNFDQLPDRDLGIIVNFRQTLLTTFLLYSGISYMGDEVGDYFSKIETKPFIRKKLGHPFDRLGGIELFVWDVRKTKWVFIDELNETGPIAKNLIISPIQDIRPHDGSMKVKVRMTRGHWRVDYVGLTAIESIVKPISISPAELSVIEGNPHSIQNIKEDDNDYLISFPGNEFLFRFDLPKIRDGREYELFLLSKGYYLEWIRQSWLKGKNTARLEKMLLNDAATWKELAVEFKSMEHEMEAVFWNSKYPVYAKNE